MMEEQLTVPDIRTLGLGYEIVWDDGVEITFDRLYDHRDYHIDAEVTVIDTHDLNPHLLGPVRTSITKTFRSLINELEEASAGRNWKGRLKQGAFYVLREHRKGQPVVKLSEMDAPERPPERISGIAFEGMPTLIFGDGGMGKSTLGVALLTYVQAGHDLGETFQVVQGNCLVLDWEASWEETYRRSNDVIRASDLHSDSMVYYRFCSAPLATEVEFIRQQITELNISVVLIDSAGPACGGEPESASNTLQFFAALRSLADLDRPVTTITLAHITKGGGGRNGPFGSVYWTNLPRNTFELKKAQKRGGNFIDLALHHRKTNIGTLREAVGLRMTWSDGIHLEPLDITKHAALSERLSYPDKAELALLETNPIDKSLVHPEGMSLEDLASYLNILNESTLETALERDGRFQLEDGMWRIMLNF